jgi:hypothetical protein
MVSRNARYRASNFPVSSISAFSEDRTSSLCFVPILLPDRLSFTCRNQRAQTVVDVKAPCARTTAVAFEGRNQADVSKSQFGLAVLSGDLEDNLGAGPLRFVSNKIQLAVRDMPDGFLAVDYFSDFLDAAVYLFVLKFELDARLVGTAVKFFRPPATNVVDGIKDFLGRLIYRNCRCEILFVISTPARQPFCLLLRCWEARRYFSRECRRA